jgi:electron transfer flavoprotein alpha/beta subunit
VTRFPCALSGEPTAELWRAMRASVRQIRGGLCLVISPYDQNALEVALQRC